MTLRRSAITNVFLIATTLLVASMVFIYSNGLVTIQNTRKVSSARSNLQQLEQIFSKLRDAETAQRLYLITGDEHTLNPYRSALPQVRAEEDWLRRRVASGELPRAVIDAALLLVEEKITELEQCIQLRRDSAVEPALALVRDMEGKDTMDRIRAEIAPLVAEQQLELDEALRRAELADGWRSTVFILMVIFNLTFLAWAYARIKREVGLREAASLEIQRQKEFLATTLASIGDGVIAVDHQARLTFLNPEAERLTGWTMPEAIDQPFTTVFQVVDGPIKQPGQNPVEQVLRLGVASEMSDGILLRRKNRREVPIGTTAAPIREPGGTSVGAVVVFRDITELVAARETLARGKAELEVLVEERTIKLRDMISELEHISYSITHDMRAPLRAMSAFAQLLLEDNSVSGSSPENKEYCRRILTAAGRMDTLIRDALSFTRAVLQELPLQPVNLSILLRGIIDTYPAFQANSVDIQIEGKLPIILGNESLLTQCFSNLLENAVKFVADGVQPRVRIWAEPNGTFVRIWVKDNGIGIPKHAHTRLFGMFQKLDQQYEGNGIGLAIVRKVAQRMGGSVGVESQSGRGSRFWVELRAASAN